MKTLAPSPRETPATKRNRSNGARSRHTLLSFAGILKDMPDDMAANHDFYLYGTHKQQPRRGRWLPRETAKRRVTPAQLQVLNRKLDEMAAELEGLPPDLARNHDHYLHGHPRK